MHASPPHFGETIAAAPPSVRDSQQQLAMSIAAALRAHADAGLSNVQVWLEPNTPAGIEAFAPVLEELDRRG